MAEFTRISKFMPPSQFDILWDDLRLVPVPVRALVEQQAIADFLDTETARIDALITKKRRMMSLLRVKLNGERSKTLWPEGGDRTPLMYLTPPDRQIMYGIVLPGPDVDDGVPIVKGGDVTAGLARRLCRTTRDIESGYARSRLKRDDVVFAIRGGVGDVAIVPPELSGANLTQDVARVAPAHGVDPRWLLHVLKSPEVQEEAQIRVTGATIRGLNIWELKRLSVPRRELSQQQTEAAWLDGVEAHIDAAIFALERQVALLHEHRQAWITAAVTGELELPGMAA